MLRLTSGDLERLKRAQDAPRLASSTTKNARKDSRPVETTAKPTALRVPPTLAGKDARNKPTVVRLLQPLAKPTKKLRSRCAILSVKRIHLVSALSAGVIVPPTRRPAWVFFA